MAPSKIVLLACGSFNPPTIMHLRMFELAKDKLQKIEDQVVLGGIISPVHDCYGKKDLVPATYRCEMLRLALTSSDWIGLSDWECSQESWCRTRQVIQYHQNLINALLKDKNSNSINKSQVSFENGLGCNKWIAETVKNTQGPVQIKLLCGADLLESFATPGLWKDDDIETIIGQHGLVVITRNGCNPYQFIYESDILTKYQNNILIVPEWITNDVSSSKIRRALRRHESVKYLVNDAVIDFIKKHGLYGSVSNDIFKYGFKSNFNDNLNVPSNTFILTPSPSDVNMTYVEHGNDIVLNLNPIEKARKIDEPDSATSSVFKTKDSDVTFFENLETFQSKAEIKFHDEELYQSQLKSQTKVVQYPGQAVQVVAVEDKKSGSPVHTKKVGFTDTEIIERRYKSVDICENKGSPKKVITTVKQTPGVQKVSFDQNKTEQKVKKQTRSPKRLPPPPPPDSSENSEELTSPDIIPPPPTPPKASPKKKKPPKRCSKTPELRKTDLGEKIEKNLKSKHTLKRSNSDAVMSRRDANGEAISVKIQFTKDGVKVISDKESMV